MKVDWNRFWLGTHNILEIEDPRTKEDLEKLRKKMIRHINDVCNEFQTAARLK